VVRSVVLRSWTTVTVAIGVLLAAASCDSDDQMTPPAPGQTPASPTPDARAVAEGEAVAAYRGMWDAFVAAAVTSDPDTPEIRQHATDQALRLIVGALVTNREQKQVIRGDLVLDPKVTATKPPEAPTEVTILDCVNDEKWLEYKVSGGLVDDEPGGKHRTTAAVKKTNGEWKVSSFILEDSGTC
jgi:hypothetical protein